jgi:heme-degrading monooxygenase HmoA
MPTTDAGTAVVAVANCISGPRALARWIEAAFRPFAGRLHGTDGFRGFLLLEVVHGGADAMFVSLSFWETLADFDGWRKSAHFLAAHDAAREQRDLFRQLRRPMRYDCPVDRPEATPELQAWLLERIGIDYPQVSTAGAGMRNVLGFPAPVRA